MTPIMVSELSGVGGVWAWHTTALGSLTSREQLLMNCCYYYCIIEAGGVSLTPLISKTPFFEATSQEVSTLRWWLGPSHSTLQWTEPQLCRTNPNSQSRLLKRICSCPLPYGIPNWKRKTYLPISIRKHRETKGPFIFCGL